MRKQYLIIIAILIPVNLMCQNTSLELGLIGGPEYFSVRGFDIADENYKGAVGYSTGILMTFRNSFTLNTGLLYEDNRFLIKNENNPQHKFLGQGNIKLLKIPLNIDINLNEYIYLRIGVFTGIIRHVSTEIYEYGGF